MARRRFELTEEDKKRKITKENLGEALEIFRFVLPYKWHFIAAMILLVLSSSVFLIFPDAAGEIANIANGKAKWGLTLNQMGLLLIALLAGQSLISFIRLILFTKVSEAGMADLRKHLYARLISLPVPFYDEHRVGELTSRITNDVSLLQSTFSITLAQFMRQGVIFLGGIVIIFIKAPKLAGLMLLTIPLVMIVAVIFGRFIRDIAKKRQDELAKSNVIVDESLQSINVVKSFTNEWWELLRYGGSVDSVVNISMKLAIWRGMFIVFIIAIMFGSIFFILWWGALLVADGEMPVGDLFSFILYTVFIGGAIASFGGVYEQILTALGATERIREILRKPNELEVGEKETPLKEHFKGEIAFNQVVFSYPTRQDMLILNGIDLEIKPGQKIALVGASGAGKSTIAQLMLRFYKPDSGSITIDGKNVQEIDLLQYRRNLAVVPQEVLLFGGTIQENIAYGKANASEEELIQAAKQANAWDFVNSFPEGLNTVVGERGIKLSGGQRQRIAIARAILRDPTVLILDEATSSLDAESEKVVQDALDKLMEGRTSIIIAHRLATIRNVDCIYVLENGQIVEKGTHDELIQVENGVYGALAKLQFELE